MPDVLVRRLFLLAGRCARQRAFEIEHGLPVSCREFWNFWRLALLELVAHRLVAVEPGLRARQESARSAVFLSQTFEGEKFCFDARALGRPCRYRAASPLVPGFFVLRERRILRDFRARVHFQGVKVQLRLSFLVLLGQTRVVFHEVANQVVTADRGQCFLSFEGLVSSVQVGCQLEARRVLDLIEL